MALVQVHICDHGILHHFLNIQNGRQVTAGNYQAITGNKHFNSMVTMSEKRVGLIIILLLVLFISIVWIWYGMKLKKINQQEKDMYGLREERLFRSATNPV